MCWKAQGIQDKPSVRTEQVRRLASRACRSLLYPIVRLPFCSVCRSFRFNFCSFHPFSTLTSGPFTCSFRLESFISLLLSFRFQSYIRFVYLFLSFQHVHFIASVLSLQLFPSIRYFLPFVSTLLHPLHYFFPLVSTPPFCSLYVVPFVLNSTLPFVTASHPFSTRPSCSFTSSFHFKAFISLFSAFRFKVSIPFVYLFLSFQVVHFVTSLLSLQLFFPLRLALPFLSTRPFHCIRPFVATLPFHSLLPSPFASTIFHPVRYLFHPFPFRFNSSLLFPLRRLFRLKL